AGTDFSKVVKFTIYLNSMDDFATVNEVYGAYLQKPYPARATVAVARLPKDLLVEIDAIAYLKSNQLAVLTYKQRALFLFGLGFFPDLLPGSFHARFFHLPWHPQHLPLIHKQISNS